VTIVRLIDSINTRVPCTHCVRLLLQMVITQGCHMQGSQLWQITRGCHKRRKDICCHTTGSNIWLRLSHKLDTVPDGVLGSILARNRKLTEKRQWNYTSFHLQGNLWGWPLCIFMEPAESYSYLRALDSNFVIGLSCILFIVLLLTLSMLAEKKNARTHRVPCLKLTDSKIIRARCSTWKQYLEYS
jgi:hypothetical protein